MASTKTKPKNPAKARSVKARPANPKKRTTTLIAPKGLKTNPEIAHAARRKVRRPAAHAFPFVVQVAGKEGVNPWLNDAAFSEQHHAEEHAKHLHRKHPDKSVRVIRV